ncbi:GNAT family N-acetyltransferase [Aeromicrobium sp. Root495]|uniref:GNAT family N-acetyltransferase n=1 Tax=Aeromicrobium sp. Root495 TaxID=1736550 RepID=UPI00138F59D5|nr:GNAT family N-acetyltransferase [Aeromicrobium sp. Root495]
MDAVTGIEAVCFGSEAWSRTLVEDELRAGRVLLVSELDGEVVGYVDVSVVADVADLLRVAVLPRARRGGRAAALLDAAHDRAAAAGAERVLLEVAADNEAAIGLYRAAGYGAISRRKRYYRDGSDALVLERSLVAEDER